MHESSEISNRDGLFVAVVRARVVGLCLCTRTDRPSPAAGESGH